MAEFQTGSPEWWLNRLSCELDNRERHVAILERYFDGEHPLPTPPKNTNAAIEEEARRAFRHMARLGLTNWVALVAEAPAERLEVVGFRFGEQSAGDKDVWRLWQSNQLDADSGLVHETALVTGQAFVLVWPDPDPEKVDITVEDPSQMIVAYKAGSRRERAAALKRWVDDASGRMFATLYLPDAAYKYMSDRALLIDNRADRVTVETDKLRWVPRPVDGEDWPLKHPFGAVPVVEFRANPRLKPSPFGGGRSEFARVLTIQDRINKTIFDRLVTAEFQAFRQRWAIGWDIPTVTDKAGNEVADESSVAKASVSRLWVFEDPNVKVGEFSQADFTGFLLAVAADVKAMAAISKTPTYYLLGDLVNIAADGIQATDTALIGKVGRHARNFGESWEEVLRLSLVGIGDPRADDEQTMVMWADFEHRTWGETVDAVMKMQALGVPQEELWSRLPNVTPQTIERWKAMQAQESFAAALAEPVAGVLAAEDRKFGAPGSQPPAPLKPPAPAPAPVAAGA